MITDCKNIAVIGLGYIGLPTALMLANHGYNVFGTDTNKQHIEAIKGQTLTYDEPGLTGILASVLQSGRIKFSTNIVPADCYLIAVPTPVDEVTKTADLSILRSVFDELIPKLKKKDLVIIESTIPVGTSDYFLDQIRSLRSDLIVDSEAKVDVCYCPERVLPGSIITELQNNPRIIGGSTQNASMRAKVIYKSFVNAQCLDCELKTAELVKLSENAFRDVNIAFANEVANICSSEDINVDNVISLANLHPRVQILQPGIGVGGHCIAVDPWFLISEYPDDTKLMQAARFTNKDREKRICAKIMSYIKEMPRNKKNILFMGLTYKPNVNDLRESPAVNILRNLKISEHISVDIYDPFINVAPEELSKYNFLDEVSNKSYDLVFKLVDHDYPKFNKFIANCLIDLT